MLYREIIAVCSQIHTKHINTLCGQNVELLVVHILTIGLDGLLILLYLSYVCNTFLIFLEVILFCISLLGAPRAWIFCATFSDHSLCSAFIGSLKQEEFFRTFRNVGTDNSVSGLSPKIMNKSIQIHNTAKMWSQVWFCIYYPVIMINYVPIYLYFSFIYIYI